jgi:hypothetical protein
MRPPRKQDNRKPLTLPQMRFPVSLPGAPYLTLKMWMLQPSQREASNALPQLEIPHPSPLFAEIWEDQTHAAWKMATPLATLCSSSK